MLCADEVNERHPLNYILIYIFKYIVYVNHLHIELCYLHILGQYLCKMSHFWWLIFVKKFGKFWEVADFREFVTNGF